MLIIGHWLDHNWLLEIILFVKAFRRSREANHLFHSETESVCLWCMKCDCQGTRTHLPADTHRRIHTHTLKLVIGLIKPKDKSSKISPPVFVCKCLSV